MREKVQYPIGILKAIYILGAGGRILAVRGGFLDLGAGGGIGICKACAIPKGYLYGQVQVVVHYGLNIFVSVHNEVAKSIVFKIVHIGTGVAVIIARRMVCGIAHFF